jgi:DNA-directed RNA polymerase subunit RPC12/RpoP
VLKQVEALLLEGRSIGGKELSEYLDVKGYASAAKWVYSQALRSGGWSGSELITLTEVREVHRTALSLVWEVAPHPLAGPDESPGSFRRHNIEPFRGGMTPPPWTDIPAAVADWVALVCAVPMASQPQIEGIADLHASFERIHPFIDGNGRVGRLLTNLVLVRMGYPPAIVFKRDRGRYLKGLTAADSGDLGPLGELFARAVLQNYYSLVLPAVAGPSRLIPLAALASKDVTLRALRNAALRGRLVASRGADGLWRSNRKAVDEYIASRYQRVPGASATCGSCGTEIPDPGSLPAAERMPCPNCGSKRVAYSRTISEVAGAAAPVGVARDRSRPYRQPLLRRFETFDQIVNGGEVPAYRAILIRDAGPGLLLVGRPVSVGLRDAPVDAGVGRRVRDPGGILPAGAVWAVVCEDQDETRYRFLDNGARPDIAGRGEGPQDIPWLRAWELVDAESV